MAQTIDPALAEELRRESEQTKDDPPPQPHRPATEPSEGVLRAAQR